jgi:hypothetical protein
MNTSKWPLRRVTWWPILLEEAVLTLLFCHLGIKFLQNGQVNNRGMAECRRKNRPSEWECLALYRIDLGERKFSFRPSEVRRAGFSCPTLYMCNIHVCSYVGSEEVCLEQCFSTFFWTWHTIFCRESSRQHCGSLGLARAVCLQQSLSAVVCELAELQSDHALQLKYGELSLLKFWILAKEEYPEIAVEAVNTVLHFSTTYLCELGFSALTNIKNKKRERLEQEMHVCLSSIRPRIELSCKKRQAQVSH